jgi:hypothetical protein
MLWLLVLVSIWLVVATVVRKTSRRFLNEWKCGGLTIAVDVQLRTLIFGMIENPGKVDIGEVTTALRSAMRFAAKRRGNHGKSRPDDVNPRIR